MVRLPKVVGLVLCKSFRFLPPRGKPSLIDVFHALRFHHFSSPKLNFVVYFALYDGMGEGIMELKITRMENEEDAVIKEEKVFLPGRAMHRNCLMAVTGCSFPAPGNYAVNLRFKDENDDMAMKRKPKTSKRSTKSRRPANSCSKNHDPFVSGEWIFLDKGKVDMTPRPTTLTNIKELRKELEELFPPRKKK